MQSRENEKYLQFQMDPKFNLYYMNIGEANVEEHCYFNTVKKRKSLFSILNQKRAEAVRTLQERYAFPSKSTVAAVLIIYSL